MRRCALRVVGATGPVEELLSRFRRYLELERGVVPAGAEALATGRSRGDFPCRSDEHLVAPSDCLHLRGKRASRRAARNTT